MGYQASTKGMPASIHRMLIIQSIEIQSETHRVIISIAAGAEGEICGKFHKNVLECLLFPFVINVRKSKKDLAMRDKAGGVTDRTSEDGGRT